MICPCGHNPVTTETGPALCDDCLDEERSSKFIMVTGALAWTVGIFLGLMFWVFVGVALVQFLGDA